MNEEYLDSMFSLEETKECPDCNGEGVICEGCCELCHSEEKCETCNGTGSVEK